MPDTLHILLVDDEPLVLEVSELLLETLGHRVTACLLPADALKLFKENADDFDMAIIDMNMPAMNGRDLLIQLKTINPEVKVAISSGYQLDSTDKGLFELGATAFINKPFTLDSLSTALKDLTS